MSTILKIGQSVKHSANGTGQITTIAYDFWTRQPSICWVDFPAIGKRSCRARDLVPMPAPVVPPTLRLVEEGNVA